MDKFTPGPWRAVDTKMQCNIFSATGEWIAELQEYAPPEAHRDRLWEDARLIAAAPELLEALRVFAACADELDGSEHVPRAPDGEWAKFRLLTDDYRRARAAIAKATGDTA